MSRILQMWEGMTGTVLPYALATAPTGWLLCDGAALTSGTAEHLRQALLDAGSPYGDDGSGNPLLPDLRGRHALGAGTGPSLTARALGDVGGEEDHALSVGEMPEHGHLVDTDTTSTAGSDGIAPVASGTGSATVQSGTAGNGAAHNNMPPFVVVNHIIKM
ncbi:MULTISPECIES: tail fiber protein [unclassified Halomonas]|uniref:phage tail protein n=1 Tax=unclassified Halomonas TaxID=2609666 RepID=UPI002886A25C|nr:MULTISPECIES: tail fiber protein [unclassified Halomonas]MDT0502725.1 tail fiber protein [Halomonas sp. PAR7]MDT0511009.1 tail fiber protein [Halomonas sp. LES1]MDT0592474.1 tail fiber protein [Halomonas sp. PAR8]